MKSFIISTVDALTCLIFEEAISKNSTVKIINKI